MIRILLVIGITGLLDLPFCTALAAAQGRPDGGFGLELVMSQSAGQPPNPADTGPDAHPRVTETDLRIAQRAKKILSSPSNWNRADTRTCPANAKTVSIYCALEKSTTELTGTFQHRGAAMQEARFVIDDIAPNRKNYHHRLMDYNNDSTTTFAGVQRFFRLLEGRIRERLKEENKPNSK